MAYNPNRTHARSFSSYRYENEPFASPQYENERFIPPQGTDMLSPPLTPSYQKVKNWTPLTELPPSPPWSDRKDSNLQPPVSYRNHVPDVDENYPLNDHPISLHLADQDVQRRQKKDKTWKIWTRRFRFVVRVLNLGCRLSPE